jgi:hypothetical protein
MSTSKRAGDAMLLLASEFAAVEVGRDDRGNGPRLIVRDARSGRSVFLDPLELAALATLRHEDLLPFLDPARLEKERNP